jgi:cellulose synthase/poly-beta-1,6-N-acetylglucosamine synthase-like glycosyltransferase
MEPVSTNEEDRQVIGPFTRTSRPDPDPAPLCSIVIPTYNGRALLETCLGSVFRHLPAGRAWATEVIVVDDASTDGTVKWVATHYPPVGANAKKWRVLCRRQRWFERRTGAIRPASEQ